MRIRWDQPGARLCRVVDVETGEPIHRVIEADDGEGWYDTHPLVDGRVAVAADGDTLLTERVHRAIRIEAPTWVTSLTALV